MLGRSCPSWWDLNLMLLALILAVRWILLSTVLHRFRPDILEQKALVSPPQVFHSLNPEPNDSSGTLAMFGKSMQQQMGFRALWHMRKSRISSRSRGTETFLHISTRIILLEICCASFKRMGRRSCSTGAFRMCCESIKYPKYSHTRKM